jgi:hypothetical protein
MEEDGAVIVMQMRQARIEEDTDFILLLDDDMVLLMRILSC